MTTNGEVKVIEELKSLWIQMAQKADQLGVDLFLNIIQHTDGGSHWMMYGDVDVFIENGEMILEPLYYPLMEALMKAGVVSDRNVMKEYYPYLYPAMKAKYGNDVRNYFLIGKGEKVFMGGPFNLWNKRVRTAQDFAIEFDFRALSPAPLHMLMFCASGMEGESVFDPSLPPRYGVENETVMLTPAVSAIMVAYSPRSNPMISISNTGDVLTKVRITETLRVVITTRLRKKRLSSDSLFSRGLSEAAGAAGRVSFKINKDNISTAMPIIAIAQNRLCHGNLSIIRCPSTGANTGMMQVIPLSNDSTLARRRSSSVSRKIANATT